MRPGLGPLFESSFFSLNYVSLYRNSKCNLRFKHHIHTPGRKWGSERIPLPGIAAAHGQSPVCPVLQELGKYFAASCLSL